MDYATPERRSNKNDKRAKARFNRFKLGGMHRTQNISKPQQDTNSNNGSKQKGKKSK